MSLPAPTPDRLSAAAAERAASDQRSEATAERAAPAHPTAGGDPHRPRYHFLPPQPCWINDPKPFYWDGVYHDFFQYCPGIAYSGVKHWGHAVSRDLAHWDELPVALSPTPGGPDQDGCWTGCVVRDEAHERFAILYTGIPRLERPAPLQVQCLATSTDLVHWEKYPGNPVIPMEQKPAGYGHTFRDPQAWWEDGGWSCIVGGNRPAGDDEFATGAPFLYRSQDLVTWEYQHPLYEGPEAKDECPDFFPLDGPNGRRWVLLSSRGVTAWAIGRYEGRHFTPEAQGSVDGPLYYAAKTLLDSQGRRILFGWIREDRPREAQMESGWSGAISLPRVLSLLPDGTIGQAPAPELERLRGEHLALGSLDLGPGREETTFDVAGGDCIEVAARFAPGATAQRYGLVVQGSDEVLYDPVAQTLAGQPLALAPDEPLDLRVYVDRSVIEVFANGRVCRTLRSYHQPGDALTTLRLVARGGGARVETLDVWRLGAASTLG